MPMALGVFGGVYAPLGSFVLLGSDGKCDFDAADGYAVIGARTVVTSRRWFACMGMVMGVCVVVNRQSQSEYVFVLC